jgi:hypothetical protein
MSNNKVEVRKYMVVDKETGEVVAEDAMFIGKKAFVDKGFRKVFVGFLRDIVMDKEIAGKAIRLLLYIIENLKANDLTILLYHKIVCEELGITKQTYYNWLRILIKKGILEKTDIPNIYRLVPYSAVNGQVEIALKKLNIKNNGE